MRCYKSLIYIEAQITRAVNYLKTGAKINKAFKFTEPVLLSE